MCKFGIKCPKIRRILNAINGRETQMSGSINRCGDSMENLNSKIDMRTIILLCFVT